MLDENLLRIFFSPKNKYGHDNQHTMVNYCPVCNHALKTPYVENISFPSFQCNSCQSITNISHPWVYKTLAIIKDKIFGQPFEISFMMTDDVVTFGIIRSKYIQSEFDKKTAEFKNLRYFTMGNTEIVTDIKVNGKKRHPIAKTADKMSLLFSTFILKGDEVPKPKLITIENVMDQIKNNKLTPHLNNMDRLLNQDNLN